MTIQSIDTTLGSAHNDAMASLDSEAFEDLKQFIAVSISQQTAQLTSEMVTKEALQQIYHRLDKRLDEQDEKLDLIQEAIAEVAQDHEQRITRLERRTA